MDYTEEASCLELITIARIKKVLDELYTTTLQYNVDNKYRIDLYIPDLNLAIECADNNDIEREAYIVKKLDCAFYRFNPYSTDFDVFKEIGSLAKIIIAYNIYKLT